VPWNSLDRSEGCTRYNSSEPMYATLIDEQNNKYIPPHRNGHSSHQRCKQGLRRLRLSSAQETRRWIHQPPPQGRRVTGRRAAVGTHLRRGELAFSGFGDRALSKPSLRRRLAVFWQAFLRTEWGVLAGWRLSRPRCRGVGAFDSGPAADGRFVTLNRLWRTSANGNSRK
jgi:hypothetical protein